MARNQHRAAAGDDPAPDQAPARRAAPTLDVVAGRAGVSRATASRVLAGGTNVSEAARAAVMSAAAELGYSVNRAARAPATRRSDSIAFVVSETEDRLFADPYFLGVLRGAHAEVAARNLQLLFTIASSEAERRQLEQYAGGGHLDGIILVSLHGSDPLPHRLEKLGVPVVLCGRPFDGDGSIYSVDADNLGGARAATDLLVRRGARRIAHLHGPHDMAVSHDRAQGYRSALTAAGLRPAAKRVAEGDFTTAGGQQAMRAVLRASPDVDAVFAASDSMAIGALQVLEAAGRRVPDDVAVVGFDDSPSAGMSRPSLTTVRQPLDAMGCQMARSLIDRIEGVPGTVRIVLPTEMVLRQSA